MTWPTAPLGEVCEIISGATPKTSNPAYWGGGVPWATPADLSQLGDDPWIGGTERTLTREGLASCSAIMLPPGSVLLSSRAPIGHVAINTVPMATNQGFKSLIPRPDRVDALYLYHWLRAHRAYLQSIGNGATFKEVSRSVVARVEIPLPPLSEQRRIAAILNHADVLRAKRRRTLTFLDDLTQAVFLDMFGDPDAAIAEGSVHPLSDFVMDLQGGRSLVASDGSGASRNRVLKISAVTQMRFRPTESKDLPDDYQPPLGHYVRAGDLLISRANTAELVGAIAYVWETPPNLLLPDKLWRFIWRSPDAVEPLYVWALMQTPAMRRQLSIRSSGTGGSMKNISKAKLLAMPVPWCPFSQQQRFAEVVRRVERTRGEAEAYVAAMDSGRASLQSQAFARGDSSKRFLGPITSP